MTQLSLRRNWLAYPGNAGWCGLATARNLHCGAGTDSTGGLAAAACIAHWVAGKLPLVVTRQPCRSGEGGELPVALGLPAPLQWARQRIALQAPPTSIGRLARFPEAANATFLLPLTARDDFSRLCAALAETGTAAHVYGAYGWQLITGMDYLHDSSDIDLTVDVRDVAQADAAAAAILSMPLRRVRVDAELAFPDGRAVAALEWAAWRGGRVAQVLVKSLRTVALESVAPGEPACRPL